MDIRLFFGASGASSSQPTDVMRSQSEDENDSIESNSLEPSPAKKKKTVHEKHQSKSCPATTNQKYNNKWEEIFNWLIFDDNFQGAFFMVCRKRGISLQRTGGTWISRTGRRRLRK